MQVQRTSMPSTPVPGAFLRVAQVAAQLNVHRTTVYRAIESGDLAAVRLGQGRGGLRVSTEALAAYLAGAEVHSVNRASLVEVA